MRISELRAVSQEAVQRMNEMMSKNLMFNSVEQFIILYNMKALDSRNPAIDNVAKELLATYSNLVLLNGRFIIETPTESAVQTSISVLRDYSVLIKLKRIATLLLDDNYPLDTKIVFNNQQQGRPFVTVINGDTGETELEPFWANNRIVVRTGDFANNLFTAHLLKSYDEEGESCYFNIEDLVDIDDSFILNIEQIIKENTLRL